MVKVDPEDVGPEADDKIEKDSLGVPIPQKRRERPPAKSPGRPKGTASLEARLSDFYSTLVGGLFFVDPDVAQWSADQSAKLAAAHAAWAKENLHVRRFLTAMVTGGIAAAAIGQTAIWALGCYAIMASKRGQLDPRFEGAAVVFGIPLFEPPPPPPDEADAEVSG